MEIKKAIAFAVIGAVGGTALAIFLSPERKTAAAADLFPEEKLQGYRTDTRITVVDPGKAGGAVIAWAFTDFGIRPEQISPTAYFSLKHVRKSYPDADRIAVFVAEDSAMAKASNWVALAEFHAGVIRVRGGLPTEAQLDSLAAMGQPLRRPTLQDIRVAAAVFDSTGGLAKERWKLSRTLVGAPAGIDKARFANLDLETTVLHSVGKASGRSAKEVQATVVGVTRYYWLRAGDPL